MIKHHTDGFVHLAQRAGSEIIHIKWRLSYLYVEAGEEDGCCRALEVPGRNSDTEWKTLHYETQMFETDSVLLRHMFISIHLIRATPQCQAETRLLPDPSG